MNIQELKERVIGCFSPYKDHWYLKSLDKVFEDYEQSNKSDLEEFKDKFADFPSCRQEIQGMKKEIEALKKQVKDDRFYSEHGISELKQECIRIDRKLLSDKKEETKQETYYVEKIAADKYNIINSKSGNPKTAIIATSEFWNIALEICRFYNSMEASK